MKKICLLLVLIFALSGCSTENKRFVREYYEFFDTYTIVVSYGREFEFRGQLERLDSLLDPRNTEFDTVALADLIARCEQFKAESNGTFDITLGKVYELYKHGKTPTDAEVAEAAKIERYDFGAVGKGYALDVLVEYAEQNGFIGTISLGGSVAFVGERPDGQAWTLGITSPNGGIDRTIELSAGSFVATSGIYARGEHIIDPRTLKPATENKSITVVCDSGLVADFLSTAEFIERNDELLKKYNAEIFAVES